MNASSPSLSRPIELSMPPVVSIVRQGGLPARRQRDRLRQDAAQASQVDQARHLAGIAERSRCDHHGIGQHQAAKLDFEVDGALSQRCETCNRMVVEPREVGPRQRAAEQSASNVPVAATSHNGPNPRGDRRGLPRRTKKAAVAVDRYVARATAADEFIP